MLLPAQAQKYCDSWATCLKNAYAFFGIDAPSEATTLSAYFDTARKTILGDGLTQYGLGSPTFQQNITAALNASVLSAGYDVAFKNSLKPIVAALDSNVLNNLPSGWKFANTVGAAAQNHPFDFYLTRLNAINPATPATPAAAGVLLGVVQSGGQMPAVATAGNAPRVCHTLVGAFDYLESLPSAQATQVVIANNQSAYSYTIAGTVPAAVTKVRIYRGYYLGGASIYFWLMDVAVTAGAGYPVIYLLKGDPLLRADIVPPGWLTLLITPEFAAIFALAYATAQTSTQRQGQPSRPLFSQVSMLSPLNVAVGKCLIGVAGDGYMGVGNALPSAMFDYAKITAANTFTHTGGAIQVANLAANNAQGYAGATGLQYRVLTALTGGTLTSVSISYHYLQASTGQTIQAGTLTSAACSGTASGSTCAFTVPAGQLVLDSTVTAVVCSATAGDGVIEGTPVRSY
jgi:hypothetical protein